MARKTARRGRGARGFDAATATAAFSTPETQWISYGIVDPDADGSRSVQFDPDFGPLINVTLQPSGTRVRCRVSSFVAGNGEGEWHPFLAGDEVLVAIPEGDERAGCVIIGRLNQAIDQWPTQVGGQDATQNNFAFRRGRTPFIWEQEGPIAIRSSKTGAAITIDQAGDLTLSSGDKGFLHVGSDFLGLQSGDGTMILQANLSSGGWSMTAGSLGATTDLFQLGGGQTMLLSQETISLAGNGATPAWHVTSIESIANLLVALIVTFSSPPQNPFSGLTSPTLAAAALSPALALAATMPLDPAALLPALILALQSPPNPPAFIPALAASGVMLG